MIISTMTSIVSGMPIERGQDWGWPADDSTVSVSCASDVEVAAAITAGVELVRVVDGDLARTLGLAPDSATREPTWHVPIDAMRVWLGEEPAVIAAAHVVVGSWRARAGWCAAMNAAFIGRHNLAPRGHPGDGFADLFSSNVRGSDRVQARRRSLTGTHVPHPDITITRTRGQAMSFDRPRHVRIDGEAADRVTRLRFEVVPDAIVVAI